MSLGIDIFIAFTGNIRGTHEMKKLMLLWFIAVQEWSYHQFIMKYVFVKNEDSHRGKVINSQHKSVTSQCCFFDSNYKQFILKTSIQFWPTSSIPCVNVLYISVKGLLIQAVNALEQMSYLSSRRYVIIQYCNNKIHDLVQVIIILYQIVEIVLRYSITFSNLF